MGAGLWELYEIRVQIFGFQEAGRGVGVKWGQTLKPQNRPTRLEIVSSKEFL